MMTTLQLADRYYVLATQNNHDQIQEELFADTCISIEPNDFFGPARVQGIQAIKEKAKAHHAMIEQVFSSFCNMPIVAGDYFACTMGMDVKYKGQARMYIEEICIFHCQNGKIISEQFFF